MNDRRMMPSFLPALLMIPPSVPMSCTCLDILIHSIDSFDITRLDWQHDTELY